MVVGLSLGLICNLPTWPLYMNLTPIPYKDALSLTEYATCQAHSHDSNEDIYIFRDIRYALPPVGSLRWTPPQDLYIEPGVQDGNKGGSCFQSTPHQVEISI